MTLRPIILFAAIVLASGHMVVAQSVDDIVAGYVGYIGGARNWKKVKSMKTEGTYDYGGMIFPFHTMAVAPDKYKFVVPLDGKYFAQGFDGNTGWQIDGFKNETVATPLSGKRARAMANEARVEIEDPLISYKAKGHTVTLAGRADCRGIPCFELLVVMDNGEQERWHINEKDYSLVMIQAPSKNTEMGGSTMQIYFSDYRMVDRVRLPFHAVCEIEGQVILTIKTDTIILNEPIAQGEFSSGTGIH
jgi:hypothetical protein